MTKIRFWILGACLLLSFGASAALIGQDDFDGAETYLAKVNSDARNQTNLAWDTVDRATVVDPHIIDTRVAAGSFVGLDAGDTDGFLESTQTDPFFAMYRAGVTAPRTLTYTFNIDGYSDLSLSMDWVASGDIPNPGISVSYSLDGVSPIINFVIGTSSTDWIETMEDGRDVTNGRSATVTVNGVMTNSLSDVFQTYAPTISGTGSVLTVTLTMTSGVGGPAYGLDNLELHGTNPTASGYEAWIEAYGLIGTNANRTADPDGDDYDNMLEYALGLNPGSVDAAGADRLVLSSGFAQITLLQPDREDVFYQIMRSSDAAPGNEYEDWEIFSSRWKTDPWVGDFSIEDPASGVRTVRFAIPPAYTNHAFKCVVMDPGIYPEFSWDRIETWTFPRRPNLGQDGFEEFTAEDFEFIASMGITVNNLEEIPEANGVPLYSDLDDVLSYNPSHKHLAYVNGAIHYPWGYGELSYSNLTYEDYGLWDEMADDWAISWTAVARPYIDYRKPAGFQRQCDLLTAYETTGDHGIFIDALAKTGGAMGFITHVNDKLDYLDRYFDFLSFMRSERADAVRMVNAQPGSGAEAYLDEYTTARYRSLEALVNTYFNGLYFENWYSLDKDGLAYTLDWLIERWTRHGRLFCMTAEGAGPANPDHLMHLAAAMTVMGRNTFVRFNDGTHLRYREGGWKNPSYWEFLADKKIGAPVSGAIRTGYVYTREFEFAQVVLDVDLRTCRIEWLNDDGSIQEVWEKASNVSPNAVLLGEDDFDGNAVYLNRTVVGSKNTSTYTWDIVNRLNVLAPEVLDTSLVQADGSAGDGIDTVGFLKSNKADNLFAMYRVSDATMTYTFDVSGCTNLSLVMDWAVAGDMPDLGIRVVASMDGGVSQTIFQVVSDPFDPIYAMEDGREVSEVRSAVGLENGVEEAVILNEFQTFDSRIEGTGNTLTILITQTNGIGGRSVGFDNLKLYGETVGGYNEWISGFNLTGNDVLPSADRDGDELGNFAEYAFGGDPTHGSDRGYVPTSGMYNDGSGTNFVEYVYARRTTPDHGLTYAVETSTNLLSNDWDIGVATELPNSETINANFEAVTHRIPAVDDAGFVRLRVEQEL